MDELQSKRESKFWKDNKYNIYEILKFILNKDKIKEKQETFEVSNIKAFRRMEELLSEMYTDTYLVLRDTPEEVKPETHLTVLKVTDRKKLPYVLNQLLNDCIGENYTLTKELMVIPNCLSFSNDKDTLYLFNYDSGTVEV